MASVTAGDGVTYTYIVSVHNYGPSDAQSVTVTDTWPAGFTRGALPAGCADIAGGPNFSCNLSTIAAGGNGGFSISYTVPAATLGAQTNSVTVSSTTTDPGPNANTASDTNTVTTSADLSITKSDGVASVTAGDGVTYTYVVSVHNYGPSDAQSVTVTDTWPAGFTRGALPAGCADIAGGPNFSCNLNTIAAGGNGGFSISYTVPAATLGAQTNSVTVSSTTTDPGPNANTASDTNTVTTSADLSITKSGPASATAGASAGFAYTLTVTNNGPSVHLGGITVTDTLPTGFAFQPSTDCTAVGQNVTCSRVAVLAVGGTTSFTINVKVASTVDSGPVVNSATVSSTGTADDNPANNTGSNTITINEDVQFVVTKAFADETVTAGTPGHTFTVTVKNNGVSDADNVVLADTVDTRLVVTAVVGSAGLVCAAPSQSISCTQAHLGPGATATITVTYNVQTVPTATVNNTAAATSDEVLTPATGSDSVVIGKRATSTTVTCAPSPQQINLQVTCTAVVTDIDSGSAADPYGQVAFTSESGGTFSASAPYVFTSPNKCTLVSDGVAGTFTSSCSVKYTTSVANVDMIGANYLGSDLHLPSAAATKAMAVFYDPNGGFVTGGGYIQSPTGAAPAYPTAVGKANYGFVAKYLKNQPYPQGETEFQFKPANINFHSTSLEWLIISKPTPTTLKAWYQGYGTNNGGGVYRFQVTVIDGGSTDYFRIRIWDNSTGAVLYDNMGTGTPGFPTEAPNGTNPSGPNTLGAGGNIVVHDK